MNVPAPDAPRVDFYVLSQGEAARFACRLAEKAAVMGHRVSVLADGEDAARRLDELMWTFRQDSFLPHALAASATAFEPVVIHGAGEPAGDVDVLLNLRDELPDCAARAARVAELVPPDDAGKKAARTRFAHHRDHGYEVASHDV